MKIPLIADLFLVLLIPIVFLAVSLLTLSDYGINWDSSIHFIRGQSYLRFILTGDRDFLDVPAYPQPKGAPDTVDFNVEGATNSGVVKKGPIENPTKLRRSYYQSDFYTFNYFMTNHVHTHPEVNDLLLAFSNYIFYQKLGILDDVESYHVFIVLVTFAIVAATSLWVYQHWGVFASVVATSSLALYPLVFAESHFNFKDPILMSFFGLSILAFQYGFSKSKSFYIILSAILVGFAVGTKFNALFLAPILGLWLLLVLTKNHKETRKKAHLLIPIIIFPFISLAVLYIFSPYLWADPIGNFMKIVKYYQDIGIGTPEEQSAYLVGGWNTYPLLWIFYTTPLPILLLSAVGLFYSIFLFFRQKSDAAFLVLLMFSVPIVRVMWPGANIYGGVRQIMEFVPAMAILSGVGANYLVREIGNRFGIKNIVFIIVITGVLVEEGYTLIKLHPNQNVYFNQLVGGLGGAREKQIPSWGNSFGNAYLQGIEWLNANAEPNARLALAVNYISSIPRLKLRSDIDLDNAHFSGTKREGEYAMELYFDWPLKSRYKYSYYETFLDPIYEVRVDGVPLLKIWKNNLEYTKAGFAREVVIKPQSVSILGESLRIDFEKQIFLTRLIVEHSSKGCQKQNDNGFVSVSMDGKEFTRDPNPLFDPESPYISVGMDEDTFDYPFAARPAISIIFNTGQSGSCILKDYEIKVWGLAKSQ